MFSDQRVASPTMGTDRLGDSPMERCFRHHLNWTFSTSTGNFTLSDDQLKQLLHCQEQLIKGTHLQAPTHLERKYTMDLITYYIMGIAGVSVCCLGIVGNLLSALVLTRRKMYTSTYCYLAALAICDLFFVVATLALISKDTRRPERGATSWLWGESGIYPYLFPYLHPFAFTLQVTSVWLTLAFTVDRYIMICHPYRSGPFCTVRRARVAVACIVLSSFLFNVPRFFEYQTVSVYLPPQKSSRIVCDLTPFGSSRAFRELYHSWFYIVFDFGLPFVTLAILNAFLVDAVRTSRRRRRQELNSSAERNRADTTVMLIGVVVIFFICQLPALVSRVVWAFDGASKAFRDTSLYTLNEVGSFLVVLNSSINIVPYYFFGKRFRKQFLALFCRCAFATNAGWKSNLFKSSATRRDTSENNY